MLLLVFQANIFSSKSLNFVVASNDVCISSLHFSVVTNSCETWPLMELCPCGSCGILCRHGGISSLHSSLIYNWLHLLLWTALQSLLAQCSFSSSSLKLFSAALESCIPALWHLHSGDGLALIHPGTTTSFLDNWHQFGFYLWILPVSVALHGWLLFVPTPSYKFRSH